MSEASETISTDSGRQNRAGKTAPRRRKLARSLHRWLGLLATLPLLWLAVSGFILNHADSFGLHDKPVTATWVLNHYHQLPEGTPVGIAVGERKVSEWDGTMFLDEKRLDLSGELVGAVPYRAELVIASRENLIVIDGSGGVTLEHDEISLPALPLDGIASDQGVLMLKSGDDWWRLSENLLEFESIAAPSVAVTPSSPLSKEASETLLGQIRQTNYMPFSRVLLDAHSGKLFGNIGVFINDLAVLSIIVLTFLGLRLFPKRRNSERNSGSANS